MPDEITPIRSKYTLAVGHKFRREENALKRISYLANGNFDTKLGQCMDIEGVKAPSDNIKSSTETQKNPKMEGEIDFYYFPPSPPSRAVLLLIKALGIKYNPKIINLLKGDHLTPEYSQINPQHVIPTIVENGFILWESRAIMEYLVTQYAKDDSFLPKDPRQAGLVRQKLYFDATTLFARLFDYMYLTLFFKQPPVEAKLKKFEEALAMLDKFLEKTVWVAGPHMTIADFAIVSTISTAEAVQVDLSKYQNIVLWYERAKKAMAQYDYEQVMQGGANILGDTWKKNTQNLDD